MYMYHAHAMLRTRLCRSERPRQSAGDAGSSMLNGSQENLKRGTIFWRRRVTFAVKSCVRVRSAAKKGLLPTDQ